MSIEIGKLEIKSIVRRRKKVFFISSALIFFICFVVAFILPPVYKSSAMIVVENQEIPDEYVKSTITTFVSERLELISNKILSPQKLLEIIQKYQLYPGLSSKGKMVSKMKKAVRLKTVDVSIHTRQSSRQGIATIAFYLSFEHNDPEMAKIVADTLANLYVEEDRKARIKQATTTTMFLEKELEGLRNQVKYHEEKISRFKAKNIKQLPGSTAVFSQSIFRLEQDFDTIDTRIRTNKEKIIYLKSQIANIDPLVPIITEEGEIANNPQNRLKLLRLQLIQMQSNLSDKHPDIIRIKSEIKKLEAQSSKGGSGSDARNRLTMIEKELAVKKGAFGDKHPDVIRLSREADLLKRQISTTTTTNKTEVDQSDNPGYMNIKAQIIVAESEIEGLRKERSKVSRKLEDYQQRLESAPFVDEEYNQLILDYQNAKQKFNEVSGNLHSAKIAKQMDTSDRGQRFRIDLPANYPDRPYKPKRLLIILMGVVLGFGCGILTAALLEGLDSSVKSADELELLSGVPVLAAVSFYDSPRQKRERRIKKLIMMATSLVFIFVLSLIINWYVMPINELWAKFEDRLIEIGMPIEKTLYDHQTF